MPINATAERRMPWILGGICLVLTTGSIVFVVRVWLVPAYHPTADFTYSLAVWQVPFLVYPLVGALIAANDPGNRVGRVLCAVGVLCSGCLFTGAYATDTLGARRVDWPASGFANWFTSWAFFPALGLIVVYVPLLFPSGRVPAGRWQIVGWTGAAGIALTTAVFALAPEPLDDYLGGLPNPYGILPDGDAVGQGGVGIPLTLVSAVVASTSLVQRLRRATGVEREQLKWIAFAGAILAGAFFAHLSLQLSGLASEVPWYWILWGAALCGLPVAAGLAILRHGLFDIDVVINRTLVYATLTALVTGSYALLVTGVRAFVNSRGGFLVPVVATGTVAVAFRPLHDRVQRGIDRLLYGERDDPYGVLVGIGQRLEGTRVADDILPTIARTIAETLKLPYAEVIVTREGAPALTASAGSPGQPELRLPLVYQAETIGELVVAGRAPGEALGAADRKLLRDLARHVGVAAHAVRLTEDLLASRQRLVTAREEKRRRLRRDLHDGLGSHLAALTVQAGALRALVKIDPEAVEAELSDLRRELQTAVGDIRRLVHDLRPPALDELGLAGAIRERAARFTRGGLDAGEGDLAVAIDLPDCLLVLPAAVEVAVYRIAEEALTNVVKHAGARCCAVHLAVAEAVELRVEDDGVGLADGVRSGVGLVSIRERTEELGGSYRIGRRADGAGTELVVRLPLPRSDGRG